jgi:hypothetical protein
MVDELLEAPGLTCSICGRRLGLFPEDQPDWPTGPICGDCYQARQMDDEIWSSEMDDDDH